MWEISQEEKQREFDRTVGRCRVVATGCTSGQLLRGGGRRWKAARSLEEIGTVGMGGAPERRCNPESSGGRLPAS